jgi:type IV pilus assembly protein PilB
MRGLAQTLVLTGAVRAADMSAAIAQAGGADGPELQQLLVSQKLVTEGQVAEAIALHTGHRYVDLASIPLDPNVVALVPGNLCRKYGLIPVDRRGDRLTVGVLDPTDIVALDDVASITDLFVEPVVVAQDALTQMFERFLRSDEELSELSMTIEDQTESNQAAFTETL